MFKKDMFIPVLMKFGRMFLFILLGIIAITYLFVGSNLFLVKEIEVLNSRTIDEESFSKCRERNIFLISADALRDKIGEIPEVKSIIVRKELPGKLTIEIQEYIPRAILNQYASFWAKLIGDKTRLAVSEEGIVFPFNERVLEVSDYPSVIYEDRNNDEELPEGKNPWPGLKEAMQAYLAVNDAVPISIIKLKKDNSIFLYSKNNKTEVRMNIENYEKQTKYFEILMKYLPSPDVEYIDLRFDEDIAVKP